MSTFSWRATFGFVAAVVIGVWLMHVPAFAQVNGQGAWLTGKAPVAAPSAKTWTAKTPWGHPDLQGTWTSWDLTPTQARDPNAAPAAAATDEDGDNARAPFKYNGQEYQYQGLGSGMGREHQSPTSAKRESLVYSPANGRIPVIASKRIRRSPDSLFEDWRNNSNWTRCITMGVPGRYLNGAGGGYNKAYDIVQTPTTVVLLHEMLHEARVIPLDGKPHPGPDVQMYMGDSRGHWEGQTLVVETTNFNGKGDGYGGVPVTPALKVVERFTRVNEAQLEYDVTVTDPNVYSAPWSAKQFHNLDPKYTVFEYACHEGNMRYMEGTLTKWRVDAEAAASKK